MTVNNTDLLEKGATIKSYDGFDCKILDTTEQTILMEIPKKTPKGIKCTQWFTIKEFKKEFNQDHKVN